MTTEEEELIALRKRQAQRRKEVWSAYKGKQRGKPNKRTHFNLKQAAIFFDRSPVWLKNEEMYGNLTRDDGSPIIPERDSKGYRAYSFDNLKEIAHCCRRRNLINDEQLKIILVRIYSFQQDLRIFSYAYQYANKLRAVQEFKQTQYFSFTSMQKQVMEQIEDTQLREE